MRPRAWGSALFRVLHLESRVSWAGDGVGGDVARAVGGGKGVSGGVRGVKKYGVVYGVSLCLH